MEYSTDDLKELANLLATDKYEATVLEPVLTAFIKSQDDVLTESEISELEEILLKNYPQLQSDIEEGTVSEEPSYFTWKILRGAIGRLKCKNPEKITDVSHKIIEIIKWPIENFYDIPVVLDLLADPNTLAYYHPSILPLDEYSFTELIEQLRIETPKEAKMLIAWLIEENLDALEELRNKLPERVFMKDLDRPIKGTMISIDSVPWDIRKRYYILTRPQNLEPEKELMWLIERGGAYFGYTSTGAFILSEESGLSSPINPKEFCVYPSSTKTHIYDAEPALHLAFQIGYKTLEDAINTMKSQPYYKNHFEIFHSLLRILEFDEYGEVFLENNLAMVARKDNILIKWSGKFGKNGRINVKLYKTNEKAQEELKKFLEKKAERWNTDITFNARKPFQNPENYIKLLDWAIPEAERGLIRELLERGVPYDAKDELDVFLILKTLAIDPVVVAEFLKTSKDPNMKIGKKTLLAWATEDTKPCTLQIIRLLLKEGADPHFRTEDGKTVLHIMLENNPSPSLEVIKLLVNAGVDASLKDNDGQTPLDIAERKLFEDIVCYLQSIAIKD